MLEYCIERRRLLTSIYRGKMWLINKFCSRVESRPLDLMASTSIFASSTVASLEKPPKRKVAAKGPRENAL